MDNEFLHEGIPQRQLKAVIDNSILDERISNIDSRISNIDTKQTLLSLLSHPNIASKSSVIRIYDHEIQGGTVVKPLTGVEADAPSDATVLKPIGTKGLKGIVLSNGINPEYGKRDAYNMAFAVIDEAIRNAVAVGADPERIAILDNFCWGDPKRPETLGSLVEAARGCHDAALLFRTPFISGKDSLNNEYLGTDGQRHAIPPTLLISALGIMDDVTKAVTMDLKEAGNEIYLVGDFAPVFGGSHFSLTMDDGRQTMDSSGFRNHTAGL
jgi:phosphoribosylformylglycinamidine synthase subunit PurSL